MDFCIIHNKKRFLQFFIPFFLFILLFTGCQNKIAKSKLQDLYGEKGESYYLSQEEQEFEEFCFSLFQEEMLDSSTLNIHYTLLNPESHGINTAKASLGNYRLEKMIHDKSKTAQLKKQLSAFNRSQLSYDGRLLFDTLTETLNTSLMAKGLELYEQPLAPTIGIQAQLPILLAEYSFHSFNDVEDYLALLSQMDSYYKEIMIFERQKAAAGLAPSDSTIDAVIESCKSYLINPETNFLTETFETRLNSLETKLEVKFPSEQKAQLYERHCSAIQEHFLPAYELLIRELDELKGQGLNENGLAWFKDGKKYYEYLLKYNAGLSYSVPELKSALENRMEQDLLKINLLFREYPDLEKQIISASCTLTDPIEILEDLKQKMKLDFPMLDDCSYEVRYVPKYLEESLSPAFYLTAPIDDMNHNIIYINQAYSNSNSGLYTTLAHEGFPGHLYQTVYNRSHTAIPLLSILSCSAANEGWATYVENYACTLDHGLPDGVGEYQALARSFSLCAHGILDIGINYEGWTKEQASQFILNHFTTDSETINQLWQTMIDNPTNYLEYCGGYVEILEMKKEAETVLGNEFSLYDFHQFLLDIGPIPFSVIRSYFNLWLNNSASESSARIITLYQDNDIS